MLKEKLHWFIGAGVLFFLVLCSLIIPGNFSLCSRWFIGLGLIAVCLGHGITWFVRWGLRKYAESYGITSSVFKITDFQKKRHTFQPFLVGVFERTFFTILIAYKVPAVGAGLILWITVKMVVGWSRYTIDTFDSRVRAFNALMMNLTSLLFAVLGGLIINGEIPLVCYLKRIGLFLQ